MTLPVLRSIRARVALWFTLVVALFVIVFGVGGYVYLDRAATEAVDSELTDAAAAIANALELEWAEGHAPPVYVPRVVREFRFRGMVAAVYDRESRALVSGEEIPDSSVVVMVDGEERPMALIPEERPPALTRPLSRSPSAALLVPAFASHLDAGPPNRIRFGTDETASPPVRWIAMPVRVGPSELVIGVVHSLANQRRIFSRYKLGLTAGIPLLLALSALGGWMLARTSLGPVATMTERAARIGATTLHDRLPVTNPGDELGRLATVFNDLLERIDRAFDQQRQFIADASHELRTPVAIISGEAELALSRDERPAAELRDTIGTIRHEARRLSVLVEDLFLLARGQAGEQLLSPAELYLEDLVADCARAVRSLAQARRLELRNEVEGDLPYRGDEALLKRLVMNLLDNAIKYTPEGGTIVLTAEREPMGYVLRVSDTGRGIAEPDQPALFTRFRRVRRGASDPGGAGLGLAISRWIAEAHGGTLDLESSGEGGSTFALRLPVDRQG